MWRRYWHLTLNLGKLKCCLESEDRFLLSLLVIYRYMEAREFLKTIFIYLFIFRARGKGRRKRGRETSMCSCLLRASHWRPGLQPRHVPRLGIEPATLWFTHWHSIHWTTPAGAVSFMFNFIQRPLLLVKSTMGASLHPRADPSRIGRREKREKAAFVMSFLLQLSWTAEVCAVHADGRVYPTLSCPSSLVSPPQIHLPKACPFFKPP